jgi:hypothetical protein
MRYVSAQHLKRIASKVTIFHSHLYVKSNICVRVNDSSVISWVNSSTIVGENAISGVVLIDSMLKRPSPRRLLVVQCMVVSSERVYRSSI